MKRYVRPIGILSGAAAREAVAAGLAAPLAGGPLAYALVEIIERSAGVIARRIVPASPPASPVPAALPGSRIMGILNVTPDSFSDGGRFTDVAAAVSQAEAMVAAGAAIIDVGGESTRPGARPVDPAEETDRVVPVIEAICSSPACAGVDVSVDTRNAVTMRAAVAAGATLINDVSALTHDPDSLAVAAGSGARIVLMHMQGTPETMQVAPRYDDVALDVHDHLEARIAACEAAGIPRSRLIVDPGIGFGKTVAHNLALLDQLTLFHSLGVPLLVGVSRKGFIARVSVGEPPERRLGGSLAAGLRAVELGAHILRVHDVAETAQALRLIDALGRT